MFMVLFQPFATNPHHFVLHNSLMLRLARHPSGGVSAVLICLSLKESYYCCTIAVQGGVVLTTRGTKGRCGGWAPRHPGVCGVALPVSWAVPGLALSPLPIRLDNVVFPGIRAIFRAHHRTCLNTFWEQSNAALLGLGHAELCIRASGSPLSTTASSANNIHDDYQENNRDEVETEEDATPHPRKKRATKANNETLARSLAVVLRAAVRAREARRVQSAFLSWRAASAAARAAQEARAARDARDEVVPAVGARVREREAGGESFLFLKNSLPSVSRTPLSPASLPLSSQDLARQAALRQIALRAAQRSRQVEVSAFQRWRLATATAAVERLRLQERAGSVGRGVVLAEAVLRRRDAGRVVTGWKGGRVRCCDEKERSARTRTRLNQRRLLLHGTGLLQASDAAARAMAERTRKAERARLSAAMSQRAARTLLLTRCWGAWKAFSTAGGLARRLEAAGSQAQRMEAERRRLRAEQLAWVCKAAVAASDTRRKARAWRFWRQDQGRARTEHALANRVLLAAAQRRRVGSLRAGFRRWRAGCDAVQSERALARSRAAKLGSVSAFLGTGSGSLRRTPRMDVARAFGTWVRAAEAAGKIDSLQRHQGARILFGVLRAHRRTVLARAIDSWRSAAARRAQNGRRVQSLIVRTARRQRAFFLGKAWSRIVWAAGEREATRARKVRFARCCCRGTCVSFVRVMRCVAWIAWRSAVANTAATERTRVLQRVALQRCVSSRQLRDTRAAWETLRSKVRRSRALVSGAARLDGVMFRARRR
ncbi:unnamed protein product, partial [Scytosiphon promiscuus]